MNISTKMTEAILDYWFAIEFLSQDKYPNVYEIQNIVKKHKRELKEGKASRKSIETFIQLNEEDFDKSIYQIIKQETEACGMNLWGNITFYVGKIKREKCIESIAKVITNPGDDVSPEKSSDSIAVLSLQLNPEGKYIEDSLSLSTVIWALNALKNEKANLSEVISSKKYQIDVKDLSDTYFDEDKTQKKIEEDEDLQNEKDELPRFVAEAVTWSDLKKLYKYVCNTYIKNNIDIQNDEDLQDVYGISFQMFVDQKTRKTNENDYLGLNHDYFSNDIQIVLNKFQSGELSRDVYMGQDLIDYINILNESSSNRKRINLVKAESKEKLYDALSEILTIKNAPLGKWPSRFMPALMQQVAINFAINKGNSPLFDVNGKVFSVNGPPGTGKTTLLKEIVVNNVIERAILLAQYTKPNDAFVAHKFKKGSKEENAYSSYTRKWHSIKNDEINNYSMLVTSCNNAAVENISKELPQSMIGDLKPLDNDSEEHRKLLSEISDMFDLNAVGLNEINRDGIEYSDIYFSKYAGDLLRSDNTWGMVAAPLGKKSNIKNFYFNVLSPLLYESFGSNDIINSRLQRYEKSRKLFFSQLERVKKIRDEIYETQVAQEQMQIACAKYDEIKRNNKSVIDVKKNSIEAVNDEISNIEKQILDENNDIGALGEEIDKKAIEKQRLQDDAEANACNIKQLYEKKIATCGNVSIFTKIFRRAKYEAIMKLSAEYESDISDIKKKQEVLTSEIENCEKSKNDLYESVRKLQADISKLEKYKSDKKSIIIDFENEIKQLQAQIIASENEYDKALKKYKHIITEMESRDTIDQYDIFDIQYANNIMENDIDISTNAQVKNPWFSQRYNREREKLFAYAMEMNKDFVLSSRACRDNLVTLSHYWGVRPGDDKQKITFDMEDISAMLPSLFQTLFLLVPVISSTFASVGSLFKDIKKSGIIGLLVIDEAGQAQPQMAVGSLFRSRRAIIVGDPKQVEPVVTDDLKLLKKAYNADGLEIYKQKNLSVQVFADRLNSFGTFLENGSDYPEWVGSPLLVHRRCISPMYDISNKLSYDGIMKLQTRPPKKEVEKLFVLDDSYWLNAAGSEVGNKNHFVKEQGEVVCKLLEKAFEKSNEPNIYIISPFTTVVDGIRNYIRSYCYKHPNTKIDSEYIAGYEVKRIGTVHTFQGKEANEVIFLLGCDKSDGAKGAINWVNNNIVNVAVTRAKYRLYVIGDEEAWKKSACVSLARKYLKMHSVK
ncbi:MAG: ATP-binding protein [Lachnospiraceae bacterium]|nr:ATP-binding protein [Lachnospiraceae bacterium]